MTFPIEVAMSNIAEKEETRSISQFGLSQVTVTFEENTDIYWAQLVDTYAFLKSKSQEVDVSAMVEQTIQLNQPHADRFKVILQFESPFPGAKVRADQRRFQQALGNLLSNASKYSPEHGKVVVSCSAINGYIRTSVTDKGPRIMKEQSSHLFRKFSRADSSDSRQQGGTGLGLYISKQLVERMGGHIGFMSTPGISTTFYFDLPRI